MWILVLWGLLMFLGIGASYLIYLLLLVALVFIVNNALKVGTKEHSA